MTDTWQTLSTLEQRKLLNAACGDLAGQLVWHGNRLTKDDWRHVLCGTVLGWRLMPAVDIGDGRPGMIMLGGSSLNLRKEECTDAITMAFHIGDHPEEQGLKSPPVRWGHVVRGARGIADDEDELADHYGRAA